jgi:ATP-dependent RNA helicase DDX47/RRP3
MSDKKEVKSSGKDDFDKPEEAEEATWESIGLCEQLSSTCLQLGWKKPSRIQSETIPIAVQGRDVIGLAQTGSGKTGSFALPILQSLLKDPHGLFACILAPTRYGYFFASVFAPRRNCLRVYVYHQTHESRVPETNHTYTNLFIY